MYYVELDFNTYFNVNIVITLFMVLALMYCRGKKNVIVHLVQALRMKNVYAFFFIMLLFTNVVPWCTMYIASAG